MELVINNCAFRIHPICNLYAGSRDGKYINVEYKVPLSGNKNKHGYFSCSIKSINESQKKMFVHCFLWECYNGKIPDKMVIDHISDNRSDNRLCDPARKL